MQGVLAEVGYADALLARELPDGRLMLVDGHLRAETTPDNLVPVLVLDVDEREADKLLATLDPLAGLAGKDDAAVESLLAQVQTDNAAVQELLDGLRDTQESAEPASGDESDSEVETHFHILVRCEDETQQVELLERFAGEGLECRAFVV